jgi:hypothetical protein
MVNQFSPNKPSKHSADRHQVKSIMIEDNDEYQLDVGLQSLERILSSGINISLIKIEQPLQVQISHLDVMVVGKGIWIVFVAPH